jgi:PPM family protein phosphatase
LIKLKGYAAKTDQGPYLQINEDGCEVDMSSSLFMVFDGFGGAGIGDKCVSQLKGHIKTFYTKVTASPDNTLPFYFSKKYLLEGNALLNASHYSHRLLYKENSQVNLSQRGGSSAVIGALSENIMTFISTGNCLIYLYRRGVLTKLFQQDTIFYVHRDEFKVYWQTSPLSGFGLFEDLHLEVKEVKILNGDQFILMTDGAYSRIQKDELKYILDESVQNLKKVETVFEISNERGNLDNQSMVLLQF